MGAETGLPRGPRLVRDQIIDFYAAGLPPALAAARASWGLTVDELPDPVRFLRYEALVIDQRVPFVSVTVARSSGYARVDNEGCYQVRYFATVYAWLKDTDYVPPQQMRDDYASVMTGMLLDRPSLGAGGGFRVDEGGLEVNYSDAAKVKGDRWLAGVSIGFPVIHTETLVPGQLGVAQVISLRVTLLGAIGAVPSEALSSYGEWLTGDGPPPAGLVWSAGNYYLDVTTGDVYRNEGPA